ncbi:hypothetical protein [Chenggangzhangella methanolivorans]|uniref:hypothetical protein n=1 Tax=Chenggangzhangella methanolivorans TaxID=1437009 RepID=UPI0021BDC245|nr:hypothetical protein [Chenggangzhangella methanolivorans]
MRSARGLGHGVLARMGQIDVPDPDGAGRRAAEKHDAVRDVERLVDVVGDE